MNNRKIYEFDGFRLDPGERRLAHAGSPVAVAPKVLDTLTVLLQNAGSLLSKEDLHRHLWPDTFVEDVTLARSISDLRTILGRYSGAKYIETVPKHGYRFVANVEVSVFPNAKTSRGLSDAKSATAKGLMIAVLPFTPLGYRDNSGQIFGDGLAEEIVHTLTRVNGLMVAACGSSFRFRGPDVDFERVAAELGTDLILHGTVKTNDSGFRVTAQLIETDRFTVRWSERYHRASAEFIDLQDSIAKVIVGELKPRLNNTEIEIAPLHRSKQTEAWHAFWEGRLHQHRFTADGLAQADQCFERAISLDPDYSLPYLGIASNQHIRANLAHACPTDVLPRAAEAISTALLLKGNSGEVHAAAAMNQVFWRYDWTQAEVHFRAALALTPSSSSVHHLYALWWLRPLGRFEEAITENQVALDLDPLSPFLRLVQSYLLYLAGKNAEAMALCNSALRFDESNFLAYRILGHILQQQGDAEEANEAYARAVALPGSSPVELGYFAVSCALLGEMEKAIGMRDQLLIPKAGTYLSSAIMALIYVSCGDATKAPKWMEKAIKERDPNLFTMATDPLWITMKSSQEGQAALLEIGLNFTDDRDSKLKRI